MALFNKHFKIGFLHGITAGFIPSLQFYNPVFSWNIFNFTNTCNYWGGRYNYKNDLFQDYNFTELNENLPKLEYNKLQSGSSVWDNFNFNYSGVTSSNSGYEFDFSNIKTSQNFDRFDFSGLKTSSAKTPDNSEENVNTGNSTTSKTTTSKRTGTTNASNTKELYSVSVTGNIDNTYANMNRSEALERAKTDRNLEDLRTKNYTGWILKNTFATDIPFAKKGTAQILQRAYELTGIKLEISSALGTNGNGKDTKSPHYKDNGYASHHNAENPKLDISYSSISGTGMNGYDFAKKLYDTGLFSWVYVEGDHLDVQIHPDVYKKYA